MASCLKREKYEEKKNIRCVETVSAVTAADPDSDSVPDHIYRVYFLNKYESVPLEQLSYHRFRELHKSIVQCGIGLSGSGRDNDRLDCRKYGITDSTGIYHRTWTECARTEGRKSI